MRGQGDGPTGIIADFHSVRLPTIAEPVRVFCSWTASLAVTAAFWWSIVHISSLPVWTLAIIPGAAIGSATAAAARRSTRWLAMLLLVGATASSLGGEYFRARQNWQQRIEQDAALTAKLSPHARQALPGFLARGFWSNLADRPMELMRASCSVPWAHPSRRPGVSSIASHDRALPNPD